MIKNNYADLCDFKYIDAVWMHKTSARAWCTGMTQRDWVEREVGVGIGIGNTCKSMADSCQCMTKPIYNIVK